MRTFLILSSIILIAGCAGSRKTSIETNKLNGTWIPIKQETGGTPLPADAFASQKLIISDSNYTVIAESTDKGVVYYNDDKMDIYSKEGVNAGKHFTAIYKYENEELTICYDLSGNGCPEAFDTKDKPKYFLSVFKKE